MAQVHHLTKTALERLQAEFHDLTTRGRIEVADKIERAREMGDLKENGDYHAAKDEKRIISVHVKRSLLARQR